MNMVYWTIDWPRCTSLEQWASTGFAHVACVCMYWDVSILKTTYWLRILRFLTSANCENCFYSTCLMAHCRCLIIKLMHALYTCCCYTCYRVLFCCFTLIGGTRFGCNVYLLLLYLLSCSVLFCCFTLIGGTRFGCIEEGSSSVVNGPPLSSLIPIMILLFDVVLPGSAQSCSYSCFMSTQLLAESHSSVSAGLSLCMCLDSGARRRPTGSTQGTEDGLLSYM